MAALYAVLAREVVGCIENDYLPVSISGDCLSSIGVLTGLQRCGFDGGITWLDAHADFHTRETTASGFLGGMPLAMLTGRGDQQIVKEVGLRPVPDEQVVLADARSVDVGEDEAIMSSGITHVVNVNDLPGIQLPEGVLYVHFDTDLVDPHDAPAMRYAAPNGPSATHLVDIFRWLAASAEIAAVSMSAWSPELDRDGKTRRTCMRLLQELIPAPGRGVGASK